MGKEGFAELEKNGWDTFPDLAAADVDLEATVVLDVSVDAMITLMKEPHWRQCVDLMLAFITEELETDWLAQVS